MSEAGQAALALDLEPVLPELEQVFALRFVEDPMPMPRARWTAKPFPHEYTPAYAKRRQEQIAAGWHAQGYPLFARDTPIGMRLRFAFARPQGHFNAAGVVKERYLRVMPGKGGGGQKGSQRTGADVDNCEKLILDALSGVAFEDDGAVCDLFSRKRYVDQLGVLEPQTIIELWAL